MKIQAKVRAELELVLLDLKRARDYVAKDETAICRRGGTPTTTLHMQRKGARKRLAAIVARYPGVSAYVQTDPRGCALYILPPGALKEGETADMLYNSRGIAVFK